MSRYVENNLGKGEEIVLKAKKNYGCLIPQFLWFVVMLVAFIVLNNLLNDVVTKVSSVSGIPIEVAEENPIKKFLWILIVLGLLPLIIKLVILWCMDLAVTNKRLLGKVGFIKIHALDYHIDKVDHIAIKSGFWGSIFRYQNVTIKGGGDSASISFDGISNANQFKNAVNEAIEKHAEEARKQQAAEIAKAMGK